MLPRIILTVDLISMQFPEKPSMTDLEFFYVKVDFTNIITLYFLSNTMDL